MLRQVRRSTIRVVGTGVVVVGAVEVTTKLPSEGRSSLFYHQLSDSIVTPLLRRFLGPEDAHNAAIAAAKRGWAPRHHANATETFEVDMRSSPFLRGSSGVTVFPNAIGLAAGFDKNGEIISEMLDLGFGLVEIGSVTPEPQEGNPKPRMFRLTDDLGVINRYGFNSLGADAVEQNLRAFREQQMAQIRETTTPSSEHKQQQEKPPFWRRSLDRIEISVVDSLLWLFSTSAPPSSISRGIVGVNLGKNKMSTDEVADYRRGIRQLGPYADYLVINVSSPNTPGLRDLQRKDPLRNLLTAALEERNSLPNNKVPLLVKLAPDLTHDELKDIAEILLQVGVDGVVVTNTTSERPDSLLSPTRYKMEGGGLSGAPVRERSTEVIRQLYQLTDGRLPIIGVGGVGSGHDALEKLKAGASLVQIYSMMVYEGPGVVSRIRKDLAELMVKQEGIRKLEDLVGMDHEEIYWRKREERLKQKQSTEPVIEVE